MAVRVAAGVALKHLARCLGRKSRLENRRSQPPTVTVLPMA